MTDVSPDNLPPTADVAIVGGGMVGLSLALLLARRAPALDIVLVEAMALRPDAGGELPPSFDARSTALSESTRRIFQRGDFWRELEAGVCAIETIHVSDRGNPGATRISARELEVAGLGYVIENRCLGRALMGAAASLENIRLCAPARVETLVSGPEAMTLTCGQQACRASLVVVAEGAGSGLLHQLGIHTDVRDYGQSALIANVALARDHGGVAYERFTDEGPMALLPLPDSGGERRSALVWTLSPERADHLVHATEREFLDELHRRFGFRAGNFLRCGERSRYPLRLTVATEQVRSRLVVVGNAAHALHPVAGQGFNLALRDVAALAAALAAASARDDDIGSLAVLQRYLSEQRTDQQNTIAFSHSLPVIFARRGRLVPGLRNAGLVALDLLGPLRQEFARFGAGLVYPAAGGRRG